MTDVNNENVQQINLTVTDSAVEQLRSLLSEEGSGTAVRVFVQGGGCSGFQYGFSFEDDASETDSVFEFDGVKVCIDQLSFPYLVGSSVDFVQDLMQSRFVINNPNATAQCGCGSSFSA